MLMCARLIALVAKVVIVAHQALPACSLDFSSVLDCESCASADSFE